MHEQRTQDLETFVAWAKEHIQGDEKGEAQIFLDRLFAAFGRKGVKEAGATLELRVKKADNRGTAFADLVWKPVVGLSETSTLPKLAGFRGHRILSNTRRAPVSRLARQPAPSTQFPLFCRIRRMERWLSGRRGVH